MARRRIDKAAVREVLLAEREAGRTLREAAALAGVHVATVCRWRAADAEFADALWEAEWEARLRRQAAREVPRPRVPVSSWCPTCRSPAEVRRAFGYFPFWRCSRWPSCPRASWRPRHPDDCPACRGPRFWSNTRKSVSCGRCGMRISRHQGRPGVTPDTATRGGLAGLPGAGRDPSTPEHFPAAGRPPTGAPTPTFLNRTGVPIRAETRREKVINCHHLSTGWDPERAAQP